MKPRPRRFILVLIIVTMVVVGGLYLDKNQQTTASDQPSTDISLGADQSQEVVVRFYYDSQEQLNTVAGELDIWEVHRSPDLGSGSGYVVAAVYPAQKDWLQVLGYRVEIDQEKTAELQAPSAALDPRYYYFDNYVFNSNNRYIVNFLQEMNTAYPGLTELIDIGDAWLASHSGYHRDMWVLRISNEDPAYGSIASKPPFFMFANIHAREVTTPEMAIRYIKYLTVGYDGQGGYGVDADVTWLVNHHVVYVLISQNPDGRVSNEQNTSSYRRKNMDNDDGCTNPSTYGVDLNRNHSFKWGCCGGSSSVCSSETYRGPLRGSEPETASFQAYATTVLFDWNGSNGDDTIAPASPLDTPGIFISLHSYADEILWPWGATSLPNPPNLAELETIGRKLAYFTNGVMNPTGHIGYDVDGSSDDWVYGKLGVAAYTYEIGDNYGSCGGFFPAYGCQDGIDGMPRDFWAEMRPSFIYANKIARSPYKTAYGPDTSNLTVDQSSVPVGTPIYLSGTVEDLRYGADPLQPIAAAEYFIDAEGVDGTGIAMSAGDGGWGETSEAVEATVDTSGLDEGQHYILVHGKNNDEQWGPFTAVFLNINPAYEVMLTPDSDSARGDPGMTVTYQMQVDNTGSNSDTYDISVISLWPYTVQDSLGPVTPGNNDTFDVAITVPPTATLGEIDIATVKVESQNSPSVEDTSELTTTANFYDLTLSPLTAEGSGNPGEQVGYILHLTNQGNTTDTFNFDSVSIWMVTLPSSAGPLEPGASADITVIVDVPAGASPGESDNATITTTSQGNNSIAASSTLTTTVTSVYSFEVVPLEDTLFGHARGATVDYTILVTNTGNIADSYGISVSASDWVVDAPPEFGPIEKGESTAVIISVHIPFDIDMGAVNDARLLFVSQGNSKGHQVTLHTGTFWYSNFMPLSNKP